MSASSSLKKWVFKNCYRGLVRVNTHCLLAILGKKLPTEINLITSHLTKVNSAEVVLIFIQHPSKRRLSFLYIAK